jgi:ribonuclease HI
VTNVTAGLVVFADGACEPNPGSGGWGFVAYLDGKEIYAESGGSAATTNNIMELTGALMALRWMQDRSEPGRLLCDSQYVVNGCNDWRHGWKRNGWRTRSKEPVKNLDLWKQFDEVLTEFPLTLEWVKGHAGIVGNERADELSLIGRENALAAVPPSLIEQQLSYSA